MKAAYQQHRQSIDQVVQIANNRVLSDERDAEAQIHSSTLVMLAVLIIAIAITVIIAMIITRSVTGPLVEMQRAMLEIKNDHDFTRRIHIESHDELGQTAHSFNELIASLQVTLRATEKCQRSFSIRR